MDKASSLRVQIGLLYALLAFVNIVFFSVMIFENQSDLLVRSFQLQSENIATSLYEDISTLQKDSNRGGSFDFDFQRLQDRLAFYDIQNYRFLESNGTILKRESFSVDSMDVVPKLDYTSTFPEGEKLSLILNDINPNNTMSVFQSRYHLELNENSFSLVITIPILDKNSPKYLQASVVMQGIKDRLEKIYYFMFVSMAWGVIFHLVFAVFVYKVIFRRLGLLKDASERMAGGDLDTRVGWIRKRRDELDELGDSFDFMASKIQENIATVTRLNNEINMELRIGKEVQELFLPKRHLSRIYSPGIFYRPMREVSGDIYLFFKNPNSGNFCIFLADASGHGVSAALVTVTIAMFLESLLKEGLLPHKIMGELSNLMGSRLQSSFFATAVYAEWSGSDLYICNGGHNPPLIYSSEDGFREIKSSGPPLGMVDDHEYESEVLRLNSGDRLFLYTDGLTEAISAESEMYGIERVKIHLLEGFRNSSQNQEIVDILSHDLSRFTKEFKDDVTILLLEIPSG